MTRNGHVSWMEVLILFEGGDTQLSQHWKRGKRRRGLRIVGLENSFEFRKYTFKMFSFNLSCCNFKYGNEEWHSKWTFPAKVQHQFDDIHQIQLLYNDAMFHCFSLQLLLYLSYKSSRNVSFLWFNKRHPQTLVL